MEWVIFFEITKFLDIMILFLAFFLSGMRDSCTRWYGSVVWRTTGACGDFKPSFDWFGFHLMAPVIDDLRTLVLREIKDVFVAQTFFQKTSFFQRFDAIWLTRRWPYENTHREAEAGREKLSSHKLADNWCPNTIVDSDRWVLYDPERLNDHYAGFEHHS